MDVDYARLSVPHVPGINTDSISVYVHLLPVVFHQCHPGLRSVLQLMSMESSSLTRLVHVSPPSPNEIVVSSVPIKVAVPPELEARKPQFQGGFSPHHPLAAP